jgi:hypothetical protein
MGVSPMVFSDENTGETPVLHFLLFYLRT